MAFVAAEILNKKVKTDSLSFAHCVGVILSLGKSMPILSYKTHAPNPAGKYVTELAREYKNAQDKLNQLIDTWALGKFNPELLRAQVAAEIERLKKKSISLPPPPPINRPSQGLHM